MHVAKLIGALALVLAALPLRAAEEEAIEVFKRVRGCVVSLESVASEGTGIVLDDTGLILTNAHVVAVPLPFRCRLDVEHDGREETKVFNNVKIVSAHPQLDLALVKIDPAEHAAKLRPAPLAKAKAQTGQRVYAIGNPGAAGGRVKLTKTITAGLLSGVGRVVDGASYYQIDAAINPGNSGGPLSDREGNVIGLVTLKFTEVENVGFALPLDELNLQDFKPFAQRPSDRKRAGELIGLANQVSQKYSALEKRKQQNSPIGQLYRVLALQLYMEAVVADPKNPTIYGAIGVMLQKFEEYAAAEEFFLQSLEMAPWTRDARDYRSYGILKLLQKQPADAETIWREGVAKHPLVAARIWENLAILYRDRGDLKRCGWCSAVVLWLNDSETRRDVAEAMLKLCRSRLKDAQQREQMERMIAAIPRDLRLMVRVRNLKLQQRQPTMLPAYAEYLGKLHRTPNTASIDVRGAIAVPPPVRVGSTNYVDLFAQLDASKQAVAGEWKLDPKFLKTPDSDHARLAFPSAPPPEYDLTLDLIRSSGEKEFAVGFPAGKSQALLLLDVEGGKSRLEGVAQGGYEQPLLSKNKLVELVVRVREKELRVEANGEAIYAYALSGGLPALPAAWQVPEPAGLFVGSNDSSFLIVGAWLVPAAAADSAKP